MLQLVLAHDLFHLVFQMEFEFFQTMLFHFFLRGQRGFCFQRLHLPLVLDDVVSMSSRNFSFVCIRCALISACAFCSIPGISP